MTSEHHSDDLGDYQHLYYALAIFKEGDWVPQHVVTRLWYAIQPKSAEFDCYGLIDKLVGFGLVDRNMNDQTLKLPDMSNEINQKKLGDQYNQYHRDFLESYNPEHLAWPQISDDGYLYDHLAYHLFEGGQHNDLKALFDNPAWMHKRVLQNNHSCDGYFADLDAAWRLILPQKDTEGCSEDDIAEAVRFALIRSSINNVAQNHVPEIVIRAIETNVPGWDLDRAFSIASRIPLPPTSRSQEFYATLYKSKIFPEGQQLKGIDQPLEKILTEGDKSFRLRYWGRFVGQLREEQIQSLIDGALVNGGGSSAYTLLDVPGIIDHVDQETLQQLLDAALYIGDQAEQAKTLVSLASQLGGDQHKAVIQQAVSVALAEKHGYALADALKDLAKHLDDDQVQQVISVALNLEIERDQVLILHHLKDRLSADQVQYVIALALNLESILKLRIPLDFASQLQPEQYRAIVQEALDGLPTVKYMDSQISTLKLLANHLDQKQVKQALDYALSITDTDYRAQALTVLADPLDEEQIQLALDATLSIEYLRRRGFVLIDLLDHVQGRRQRRQIVQHVLETVRRVEVSDSKLMDKGKRSRLMYNQEHGHETISIDRQRKTGIGAG